MPVTDHILHVLELLHNTFSLRIIASKFRNVASSFAGNSVLMQYSFGQGSIVSPESVYLAQRDTKGLRALGNFQLTRCSLQPLPQFTDCLFVEGSGQLLLSLGPILAEMAK